MLIAHYLHRLPADYDLDTIRRRAALRGPQWDTTPKLHFKAFLLREAGRFGAAASSYSSLYLWRGAAAFADFVASPSFKVVTGSFGRPRIETRFALDARKGSGRDAHFAIKEELEIPVDADLPAWKITHIKLTEREPKRPDDGGAVYPILYLAKPLLDTLDDA